MWLHTLVSGFNRRKRRVNKDEYQKAAQRLKELARYTDELNFASMARRTQDDLTKMRVKVEAGESTGYGVLNTGEVAVVHGYSTKGTTTDAYYQDELSILIIYKGSVEVSCQPFCKLDACGANVQKLTLEKGSVFVSQPGQSKRLHAIEDTHFLSVTIPASPLYPPSSID